jgi:hypothetical protein
LTRHRDDIRRSAVNLRRQGEGYAADGPGFYVWDRYQREVLRDATELAAGRIARPPMPPAPPVVRTGRRRGPF